MSEKNNFIAIPQTVTLHSPAFSNGGAIPARFTEDGAKLSPPLRWQGPPPRSEALALIAEDPDVPSVEPFVHLLAWDISPDVCEIVECQFTRPLPSDCADAGAGSESGAFWLPPNPPDGHGPHHYVYQIFALEKALRLEDGSDRGALITAMAGHVLARGALLGLYVHKGDHCGV